MTTDLNSFNEQLIRLGGRHINNKPRLRVVEGSTATHFACGEERVRYPIASKIEEKWLWGLKDIATGVITAKSEKDVIANKDPGKFGVRKRLSRTVTFIGAPNFIIEYYRPADKMKDGPLNWERNRYNYWYDPVIKARRYVDMIGPYPFDGRYDLLMVVKVDDGTRWGKFRLLGEDVLDEARKAIRAHEEFRKIYTDEESVQQMVDKQVAREDKAEAELADEIEQEIGPAWRRALKDNPQLFITNGDPAKMNKITKHGRTI